VRIERRPALRAVEVELEPFCFGERS
jgi:hypothetical protein